VAHQAWATGFFTSSFGTVGTLLFYGSLFTGLTYPLGIPVSLNRRFGRRVELGYEILTAVFWSVSVAWLLFVFPLDFSQLTAVVPAQLKFLLSWITNDVGRILLGVSLVGSLAFIPFYALQFVSSSRRQATTRQI